MINVYDEFLGVSARQAIFKQCHKLYYMMGELDREDCPPTGMVSQLEPTDMILPEIISQKLNRPLSSLIRFYVNYYAAGEKPYFHDDGECITCLYYPNGVDDIDEGGETQFLVDNKISAVPHVPDRLIEFDGRIPHKATSFRSTYRFTIAAKYTRKFGE